VVVREMGKVKRGNGPIAELSSSTHPNASNRMMVRSAARK
jgi:hypothetical protein